MRRNSLQILRNRRAVTPVFADVLLVTIVVAMSATLYVTVGGIFSNVGETPTSLSFRDTGASHANTPDYCCLNDTVLEVVYSAGTPWDWANGVQFQIYNAANGEMLVQGDLYEAPRDQAFAYLGIYHGSPDEASIINIGFADINSDGTVSASDHIEIRGMSKEFHFATLRVIADAREIGSHALP